MKKIPYEAPGPRECVLRGVNETNAGLFSKSISLLIILLISGFSASSQYCTSGFFSSGCAAFGDQINGFSTTGGSTNISNLNSGCSSGSYGNFTSQVHTGPPSGTVNFAIINNPNYDEYYNIFVDWNQDGDFTDAGETVYTYHANASQTVNGSFNIPVTATPGLTRMRVFANYGGYASGPCTGSTWGEVEDYGLYVAGNCNAPATVTANLIGSMSVDFSWTAVTGSLGYDYAVTTSATGPQTGTTTTNLNASVTGLTPSTLYYLHVRNKCNGYPSIWTTVPFNTLPPCEIAVPPGIRVPYVDSNSATVTWQAVGTGIEYDYIIKEDTIAPAKVTTANTTTANQVGLSSLESGKTYFFFLRVRCVANDTSNWIMDSIYVPIPCRAPDVLISNLNSDRAVASWAPPVTSYKYEIINSATALANPASGIPTINNSYLFSYLDDGKQYYIYAKSYCRDRDIQTESSWSETEYTTWALDVNDVGAENRSLTVYPNPVDHNMMVTLSGEIGNNATLSIVDMAGRVVYAAEVDKKHNTINVNSLNMSSGVYLLQYADDSRIEHVRFNKL